MRVSLSKDDSRGGVEPLVALPVRLPELGAEVRVCAAGLRGRTEAGVPLTPAGQPVRPLVHGATPPSVAELRIHAVYASCCATRPPGSA